ncbi:branched-chain amino acid ABC transporter permease/ATP-binding protein [Pseudonocardia xishanensis]|uniref:Branched-chain amino acid ABC transporter permease/ATP-binding protein n=1 Tax=Pseudonocardia xishanensis TaxID=630995 RepID=A0ABP8RYI7_9PSEU
MEVIQFAILGLGVGGITALSSLGIVLIYRSTGVVNFAQGAVGLIGVLVFVAVRPTLGTLLAGIAGILTSAAIGVMMQVAVLRPLRNATQLMRTISTLAVLVILQAVVSFVFDVPIVPVEGFLPVFDFSMFGARMPSDRVLIFLIACVLTLVLWLIYRYTAFGLRSSAVAENVQTASVYGISVERVAIANWAIGSGLACLAGLLLVPITGLTADGLTLLVVPALAVALLGGFRSFPLTLIGGIVLGVVQSEVGQYVPVPGLTTAVPFIFIMLALLLRGDRISFKALAGQRFPSAGSGKVSVPTVLAWIGVALVAVWFLLPDVWVYAAIVSVAAATVLLSLVVITGYAGQLSLMQYTLAGLGALVAGNVSAHLQAPFLVSLVVAMLVALPIGLLVGLPAVRVRGVSLAVVTIGLAVTVEALVFSNEQLNGGFGGLEVDPPTVFGLEVDALLSPQRYFTVCLLVFTLLALAVTNIRRGSSGRRLLAVRTNERAASAIGINVAASKLYAFVVGSAIAAAGGVLLSFRNSRLLFEHFSPAVSTNAVAESVVGGVGWVAGPLLGAQIEPGSLLATVPNQLFGDSNKWLNLILGLLLLQMILTNPDGLASINAKLWRALRNRLRRGRPAAAPTLDLSTMVMPGHVRREPAELVVEGLTVRFGGNVAVERVDLTVRPGQILGLIGPNGAGKSTVIEAVSGFAPAAAGSVRLGGQSLDDASPHVRARRGLARTFQSLELFEDMTVLDNIRAAADRHRWVPLVADVVRPARRTLSEPAIAAIEQFGIAPHLDETPADLPFGMRRLVAIARAFAPDPQVLLLDEPAAGLGDVEKAELGRLLRDQVRAGRVGILLVEHDMDLIMSVCDEVVALESGKVIATGRPEEIRNDPEVVRAYLGVEQPVGVGD